MELLLILSALLSALTGAVAGGRAPEVRLHQAVASPRVAPVNMGTVARQARHYARPSLPGLGSLATAPVAFAVALSAPIPAYMARRRE